MVDDQLVKYILWIQLLYSKQKNLNVKPLFPISKVPLSKFLKLHLNNSLK